ncbi:MAG TPA: pyruvate dehydrogenase (acetyl-transferring), homodimeric type [Egibacteraceae bacterium]|nr:pyruvate dehydrogenase (acetyl-transferring), homodimeric type [Egibacteraceae bacterium]
MPSQLPDSDPLETREWLDSLDAVIDHHGRERARYILLRVMQHARGRQVGLPALTSTDYVNTIPPDQEPGFPGDEYIERRIRAFIRWNAAVMVTRAQRPGVGVGGHIATYASAASLYEVGFNHFFRGKDDGQFGDHVYVQGHASPGIYARAYLEGRLTQEQLDLFRQELQRTSDGRRGLASYPHPRLMPDFWEYPTVSMGLGAINAIYQARFNRYLHDRGVADTSGSRVWAFLGDGEMDEPEAQGALSVAGREELDNLIFVVNCNLQRLDGPVRGNGKIIQELESIFRGAGWNVIKVVWGRKWDELLAKDVTGELLAKLNTTPDGQFQTYVTKDGQFIREHFFNTPALGRVIDHLSDADLPVLSRGGHDYRKVYAAFRWATEHTGQPTVILAQTIKGWTLGPDFESRNATHQMKKLTQKALKKFRDRLYLDIPDEALEGDLPPYYHPGEDSDEIQYMLERRRALGGFLPKRVVRSSSVALPDRDLYAELKKGSGKHEVATTMAFVRLLKDLFKHPDLGKRFVPIIPDEARTFGMDSLFPQQKIYSPHGQNYEPVDQAMLLSYQEAKSGQILHEGITEAGSVGSFAAAGTSYATFGEPMIPVYVFYAMFGFQRTGDLIWSAADQRTRGFLLGATAGRTTLNGEGLQHEDGQSLLLAASNPAVIAYDPSFAYEIAVIVEDALQRMYGPTQDGVDPDVMYYLTVYNEPVRQPPAPEGLDEGDVVKGLYRYARAAGEHAHHAQVLASGSAMRQALQAQKLLADDWDVAVDVWSAPGWVGLHRDGVACDEWNRRHPHERQRVPYVTGALEGAEGPIVAVTDYQRAVPGLIGAWVPGRFATLGTDGFGLSDTRPALRRHFGIDAESIAVAVLAELAEAGDIKREAVADAIQRYGIEPEAAEDFERVGVHPSTTS